MATTPVPVPEKKPFLTTDKITTIAGAVAGVAMALPQMGVDFGHVGSVTGMGAISAFALMVLGWFTNKHK